MSYDKTDKIFFEDFYNKKAPDRTYFKQYQYRQEFEEYLDGKLSLTYEDLMGFNSYLWVRLLWSKLNQLTIKVFSIINIGFTSLFDKIIQHAMGI